MIDYIEPIKILSKYIKNYFFVETDSSIDDLPKERVYPCGYSTMIFHYGSPSKFLKKNSSKYIEPNLVLCGQQTNYYDLSLSEKTGMILIVFRPNGVKPFFNFPITELLNKNLSLQELTIYEALECLGTLLREIWKKQPELAEKFLLKWKDKCGRIIIHYATEKMNKEDKAKF